MTISVVIGRDILRQFFEQENLSNKIVENQVICDILSIDINSLKKIQQIH